MNHHASKFIFHFYQIPLKQTRLRLRNRASIAESPLSIIGRIQSNIVTLEQLKKQERQERKEKRQSKLSERARAIRDGEMNELFNTAGKTSIDVIPTISIDDSHVSSPGKRFVD